MIDLFHTAFQAMPGKDWFTIQSEGEMWRIVGSKSLFSWRFSNF